MRAASESLVFHSAPWSVWGGVLFVLMLAVLGWLAWQRSGWRRGVGGLELLRVLIGVGIAVTLNQPEWRTVDEPESLPTVVVLHDVSGSMETEDVMREGGGVGSRAEAVRSLVAKESWGEMGETMEVVIEPYSSMETPAEEATDLSAPLLAVAEAHPNLAAVVLIGDGDRNSGEAPGAAATRLRMRNVPVIAVPVGADTKLPDVEIAGFDVPTFAIAGKPLRIPFTLEGSLPREETVTVEMRVAETGEVVTQTVVLPAMGRLQESILWRPTEPGAVRLTLAVPAVGGERNVENNEVEAPLEVRKEQLRVLIVESLPRWEYRYLRNALDRDPGVEVRTLLFHPGLGHAGVGPGYLAVLPDEEALTEYDVVFLGDVGVAPDQLTAEQCVALHRLVRDQATGLVFLPGLRGHQATLWETPLAELLPVVWDGSQPRGFGSGTPGRFVLTEAGRGSLLTKLEDGDEESARVWSELPGFQWFAPAQRAKAGSEVLATHGTESNGFGRIPLIVTKTFGTGKILFMGADGAWRWRRGVEDRYHYRFWGQVVRWMAYQRNMARGEKLRLFYAPDRPKVGGSVTLNATVIEMTGEPLREGVVVAQLVAPSGKTRSLRLNPAGEEAWGLFTATFTPEEPGEHRVQLSSQDAGEELRATISVQGTRKEKRGQPARPDVLAEIAQITRGSVIANADAAAVLEAVRKLPEPEPMEHRVLLWCHPLWACFLVLLLAGFWMGRKALGTF